jgi:aspartate aminotransferase-like enzyme
VRPRSRQRLTSRGLELLAEPQHQLAGAPPMWRVGLMGVNASREVASRVLDALDAVLAQEPAFAASA